MNLFNIFQDKALYQVSPQKTRKIYVFSRKKFSSPNRKKLSQIQQLDIQTPRKQADSKLKESETSHLKFNLKYSRPFQISYQQQSEPTHVVQRRKQIRKQLAGHFQNSTLKSRYDRERTRKFESLNGTKSNKSRLLSINREKNYKHLNKGQTFEFAINMKKSSLPDLSKSTQRSSDLCNKISVRNKKQRLQQKQKFFIGSQMSFKRIGIINGSKIAHPGQKNNQIMNTETQQLQNKQLSISLSEQNNLTDNYFSLKKNTDYRKITNSAEKQVKRSNFLQHRRRKSVEKASTRQVDFCGQSLIKLQKICLNTNKISFKI